MIELLSILFRLAFLLLVAFCAILLVEALIPVALPLAAIVAVVFGVVLALQILRR